MHTWRPSLLRISSQLGIMKRLVRRLNQPMTATLIKTAKSLNITLDQDRIFSAALLRLLPQLRQRNKGWFHWSNAVRWCVMWKITNVVNVKRGQRTYFEENGTICSPSVCFLILICIGKKDITKRKKVTITSRKNKNKTNKTNKRKQQSFISAYLDGSRSRSQRAQAKIDVVKKKTERGDLPLFSSCTILKTRSYLNSALLFLVLCSETAWKRLLRRLQTG